MLIARLGLHVDVSVQDQEATVFETHQRVDLDQCQVVLEEDVDQLGNDRSELVQISTADTGGADLAGHQNMIGALKRLGQVEPEALPEQMAAFGINDKGGIMALFSSHPPIEDRIVALEKRAANRS